LLWKITDYFLKATVACIVVELVMSVLVPPFPSTAYAPLNEVKSPSASTALYLSPAFFVNLMDDNLLYTTKN
jgi:hypothetical protein